MIEVKNLSHKIGQSPILNNINLTIPNGGITALVGANGAGKSTLLSLIARLNPIQSGQILLDNYNIATTDSLNPRQLDPQSHYCARFADVRALSASSRQNSIA